MVVFVINWAKLVVVIEEEKYLIVFASKQKLLDLVHLRLLHSPTHWVRDISVTVTLVAVQLVIKAPKANDGKLFTAAKNSSVMNFKTC